jgi:hypothetical protein
MLVTMLGTILDDVAVTAAGAGGTVIVNSNATFRETVTVTQSPTIHPQFPHRSDRDVQYAPVASARFLRNHARVCRSGRWR